jgi:transcriptional regulator with XRE-family HTH domain
MERRRRVQLDVEALRRLRVQHALTQQELAERADRSILTIHNAERGKFVDFSTLHKIAEVFRITPDSLVKIDATFKPEYQSAFISYGGPDEGFARLVFEALKANDVACFFFPENAIPGERLHRTMSQGVKE